MRRLGVFGYASLVSRESASQTLGRAVTDVFPTRLAGWRRRWSAFRDNLAVEKTFARADNGALLRYCLGLNLERAEGPGPNGGLIEVSEDELRRLDLRELRYDRVEVTEDLDPTAADRFERAFAYVVKPEHYAPKPPDGAVVIAAYAQAVEAAFSELGPDHLELFCATTEPPGVELVEALLVTGQIPEGNPRAW